MASVENGSTDIGCFQTSTMRVVGIGASAGGLEPLQQFFGCLPTDTGAAFVIVQHLSPDFKSLMKELLGRHTTMPIERVEDGMRLRPNTIFLIPPKKNMVLQGDMFRLSDQDLSKGHRPNFPIDLFFHSLGESYGNAAIAIILSGTGTDGTRGVRTVHELGGVVYVQDPQTAQFDGMPQSVLQTGLADYCLSPAECAKSVSSMLNGVCSRSEPDTSEEHTKVIERVIAALRRSGDVDFSDYKRSTIQRRIERRAAITGIHDLDRYAQTVESSSAERENLRDDLLIGVTCFFRDQTPWKILSEKVLPDLIEQLPAGETLRLWCAACSSGEEAYSLGIAAMEAIERSGKSLSLKVFATDLDRASLEIAAAGVYPASITADVDEDRLRAMFTNRGADFVIKQRLRRSIVFARHDVTRDPPFTRMHLVSCRNLLIYLQPRLQAKVLASLHFALQPKGTLFLGAAETLAELHGEFDIIDSKWKIFRKLRDAPVIADVRVSGTASSGLSRRGALAFQPIADRSDALLTRVLGNDLRERRGACFIVAPDQTLIHALGDVDGIITVPPGRATLRLPALIPHELSLPVGTGLVRAKRDSKPVLYSGIAFERRGERCTVDLRVTHHPAEKNQPEVLSVSLEFVPGPAAAPVGEPFAVNDEAARRIGELEHDLLQTKETLQATIEQLETINEEQQASNEELLASNEELQSTNEELHSVNEELHTVNSEHQNKIEELVELNNDMNNLLRSTDIGTVFLDSKLRFRKFTPAAERVINLLPQDVGRPIEHISAMFDDPGFLATVRSVLAGELPDERNIRTPDGRQHLLRFHPYKDDDNEIDGVVLTFVDVSSLRDAEQAIRELEQFQKAIIDAVFAHLAILDQTGRIVMVNDAWRRFARSNGYDGETMGLGTIYLDSCRTPTGPDSQHVVAAHNGLRDVIEGRAESFDCEYPCHSPTQERWFQMRANRFVHDQQAWTIVAHMDVTDRYMAEKRRTMLVAELDHRVKNTLASVLAIARRSLQTSVSLPDFELSFNGRVMAMAQCHEALAKTHWAGIDLRGMIQLVTDPHTDSSPSRITAHGTQFLLPPRLALPLSLALHEIATNAAKYGALSNASGRVEVSWKLDSDIGQLDIQWTESGGPPCAPPARSGLGSELIRGLVEFELGGIARIDYPSAGVQIAFRIPLTQAERSNSSVIAEPGVPKVGVHLAVPTRSVARSS